MMTTERKAELFDNAILWIFEHTEGYGIEEYARALENICAFSGLTHSDVMRLACMEARLRDYQNGMESEVENHE